MQQWSKEYVEEIDYIDFGIGNIERWFLDLYQNASYARHVYKHDILHPVGYEICRSRLMQSKMSSDVVTTTDIIRDDGIWCKSASYPEWFKGHHLFVGLMVKASRDNELFSQFWGY
jgi:hypothetical protein